MRRLTTQGSIEWFAGSRLSSGWVLRPGEATVVDRAWWMKITGATCSDPGLLRRVRRPSTRARTGVRAARDEVGRGRADGTN